MKAAYYLSFTLALTLSASSCKSISVLVDGAGRALDGSAFAEKTVKTYLSAGKDFSFRLVSTGDGGIQSVFVLKNLPFIQFYGTEPDETGLFFITRVHFLFSNAGGWLEGDIGASGTGLIAETSGQAAEFSLQSPVNFTGVAHGGIRRHGRHLYGERALDELRGRKDRVQLVAGWMKERRPPVPPADPREFENYWRPVLLPETVSNKLRPSRYTEAGAAQNERTVYSCAENIRWNTAYTAELFPEHIRWLRDSGSLLRDWEEAVSWFYIEYYWDIIIRELCEKRYLSI
ncbi:MAG: hypothetical protein LBD86_03575 [Spirochaetaceae bacterium]|jgi:hypothetical protein|nr:hypothetical protein [Spirochaetaceae bacterium]